MKKSFFLVIAAILSSISANAESVVIDFTTNSLGLPSDYCKTDEVYTTPEGYTVSLTAPSNGFKFNSYTNSEALIFGKKGAKVSFSNINFPIEQVIINGPTGASGKTTWTFYEGESAVQNFTGSNSSYTVNTSGTANATYTIEITNANNMQIASIEFHYAADPTAPSITCEDVTFGNVFTIIPNIHQEITITGKNLSDDIVATLPDNSKFSVSGTLDATGGTLDIALTATEAGTYDDVLTLTSGNTTKNVAITATLIQLAGEGTKEKPFTLDEVQTINSSLGTSEKYWVIGYIRGSYKSSSELGEATVSNLAISSTEDENVYVPVALPTGDVRTALNVVDNPENIGKQVKLYGTLEIYFSTNGIRNVSEYELLNDPTSVTNTKVSTKVIKTIKNGQLVIVREGVKYNAQGVKLN